MELLRNLSDDQLALVGCLGALVVSFGLVSGSYHLSRTFRARRDESTLTETTRVQSATLNRNRSSKRRAA